jgi:hypothetical protein
LRGDIDLMQDQQAFAVAADVTYGDTITFEVCCDSSLVRAASRRLHGSCGPFDLPIPTDGSVVVEPRMNGTRPQMVLEYMTMPDDPGCGSVSIVNGTCLGTSVLGHDLIIDMTYNLNACVEVTVAEDTLRVLTHTGNVNDDPWVNVLDLQECKNEVFEPIDSFNFLCDIDTNCHFNVIDLQRIKNQLFTSPTCE